MRRLSLLFLPILAACGEMPKMEMPSLGLDEYSYHLDIRQGNWVTQDMVSQLKLGMTREQVRYVLGTPLLTDPFHADRWDYLYRYDSGKDEAMQQRRLTVYFENNLLARVAGDTVAANPDAPKPEPAKAKVIEIAPAADAAKPAADKKPDAPADKQ